MAVQKSRSRMNAEQFYEQRRAATDRAVSQQYGGLPFADFLGGLQQRQTEAGRAGEAEDYALKQQRQGELDQQGLVDQARSMGAFYQSQGGDRTNPGLGVNIGEQLLGGPGGEARAQATLAKMTPAGMQAMQQEQDALNDASQIKQAQLSKELALARKADLTAAQLVRDFDNYDPMAAAAARAVAKNASMRTLQEQEAYNAGIPIPGEGQAQVTDPLTGQPKIAFLPGTAEYQASFGKMREQFSALSLANRITNDINSAGVSGTEYMGPLAARLRQNRSQLMSTIFRARGLGAPQGPDIELVERGLIDPTSLMNNVQGISGFGKAGILQGYQGVQEEMQQLLTNQLLENPYLIDAMTTGDVAQLEPSSDLFQTIVKLRPDLMPR